MKEVTPTDVGKLSVEFLTNGGNLRYQSKEGWEVEFLHPSKLCNVSMSIGGIVMNCQGASFKEICEQVDKWLEMFLKKRLLFSPDYLKEMAGNVTDSQESGTEIYG